ncbi:hypothetical protein CHARACLAT_008839, partial [Characodon lateralis]|nr:hypothetical protein [Characodon lateralis]
MHTYRFMATAIKHQKKKKDKKKKKKVLSLLRGWQYFSLPVIVQTLFSTLAQRRKMAAIFNLLQQYRLESYYNQFLQMGVKDERDFLDGVTDEDLYSM